MRKPWLTLLGLALGAVTLACAGARLPVRAEGEVLLTVRGQVKGGPFSLGRADLARLPRGAFRAVAPGSAREARYEGLDLLLLGEQRLEVERGADTLLILAADGRVLPVTATLLRQHRPLLADRMDGEPSSLMLVWPNVDQRGLDADPRSTVWWLQGVVSLEVVSWDRTWGRVLRAPPGSPDEARRGAGLYAQRCASCHRLHGAGGDRGPPLDGVVARLGVGSFTAALATHQGWPRRVGQELEASEVAAAEVAAFLSASDAAGVPAPEEPVKPPGPRAQGMPRSY